MISEWLVDNFAILRQIDERNTKTIQFKLIEHVTSSALLYHWYFICRFASEDSKGKISRLVALRCPTDHLSPYDTVSQIEIIYTVNWN